MVRCKSPSETAVKRSALALAGLMTCSAQNSRGSGWCWWLKSSSELSVFCAFFISFLSWIEIFPMANDSMPKLPEGYPFLWNKQSCVGGSRAKSGGLHLDFLWTSFINEMDGGSGGHLTLEFFAVFVSERRQKAQLQQRSWKLQVWAWLENAKLPSVVRLCGEFFFAGYLPRNEGKNTK